MIFDVVIIGAGPAGLACAAVTAGLGATTLVLERKTRLGRKVCAGGITWNGLIERFGDISQKTFPKQYIITKYQKIAIEEKEPIIATVDREELGATMALQAITSGAEILPGCHVISIAEKSLEYVDRKSGQRKIIEFNKLVGADGSTSIVRRHLQLPVDKFGVGINYEVPGDYSKMEWHLDSKLFGSGYAWIFPHAETVSVGAYADSKEITGKELKKNLVTWAGRVGIELRGLQPQAEKISYDNRGVDFGDLFLAGDAAGLASGLTGEGIYPAIVSGEYIGHKIINPGYRRTTFETLLKNHKRHSRAVQLAGFNKHMTTALTELTAYCLKKRIIRFSAAEMARG